MTFESKFLKQEFRHDPSRGIYGDCQRAVIASFLGLPLTEVPHFGDNGPSPIDFFHNVRSFLRSRGLNMFTVAFNAIPLRDVLDLIELNNPDVVYFLSGSSPRGTNHVVLCRGNRIIHDPHPDIDLERVDINQVLTGPCDDGYWWVEVITPIYAHLL
jgi:hypothetical protein